MTSTTARAKRMLVIHFLLVYDLRHQALRSQQEFAKADEAMIACQRLEQQYRADPDPDPEIVLVGADSIDTIRQTHGHYFEDLALPVTV